MDSGQHRWIWTRVFRRLAQRAVSGGAADPVRVDRGRGVERAWGACFRHGDAEEFLPVWRAGRPRKGFYRYGGEGNEEGDRVGFRGKIYMEGATGRVLRYVAEEPIGLGNEHGVKSGRMLFDYDYVEIGGEKVLLPVKSLDQVSAPQWRRGGVLRFTWPRNRWAVWDMWLRNPSDCPSREEDAFRLRLREIGDEQALLPVRSLVYTRYRRHSTLAETEFLRYRQFQAETRLDFGGQ